MLWVLAFAVLFLALLIPTLAVLLDAPALRRRKGGGSGSVPIEQPGLHVVEELTRRLLLLEDDLDELRRTVQALQDDVDVLQGQLDATATPDAGRPPAPPSN
jgi:hypothetical protein